MAPEQLAQIEVIRQQLRQAQEMIDQIVADNTIEVRDQDTGEAHTGSIL